MSTELERKLDAVLTELRKPEEGETRPAVQIIQRTEVGRSPEADPQADKWFGVGMGLAGLGFLAFSLLFLTTCP